MKGGLIVVIATGRMGNPGVCILSTCMSLGYEQQVPGGTAAFVSLVRTLLDAVPGVHALRDLTRGVVAGA